MATRKKRITDEELTEAIINKMFEIAGHNVTYSEIKDRKDSWYADWNMTVEQGEEWKTWVVEFLKKERRYTKDRAERAAGWINLMWGLTYSNFNR